MVYSEFLLNGLSRVCVRSYGGMALFVRVFVLVYRYWIKPYILTGLLYLLTHSLTHFKLLDGCVYTKKRHLHPSHHTGK